MLIKKELAEVPVFQLPEKAETFNGYYVAAKRFTLPRSGLVLAVDFFNAEEHTLEIRFFTDGKNFLTCTDWPASAWTQQNPEHLLGYCHKIVQIDGSFAELNGIIKNHFHSIVGAVGQFCYGKGQEKRYKAWDAKVELQKKHMAMYPAYPDNLGQFCADRFFDAYIAIGKLDKDHRRPAKCSHCEAEFTVDGSTRSGQETVCPVCGKRAKYRATWVIPATEDKIKICIAAKVEGQLLLRWTEVFRLFYAGSFEQKFQFSDYAYNLHLQTDRGPRQYFYKWINAAAYYGGGWYRRIDATCYDTTYLYTDNLREVFGSKYYNVDLQAGLERCKNQIPFEILLNNLKNIPETEYFFKMGLPTMAAEINTVIHLRKKGQRFADTLGLQRRFLPMYRALDVTVHEHLMIQRTGGWVSGDDMTAFRALKISPDEVTTEVLNMMSFRKFVNYFTRQRQRQGGKRNTEFLVTQYLDYISMSTKLKVDLSNKSVRFPADCVAAHNQILPQFNAVKYEAEDNAFEEAVRPIYAKMPLTEFEADGFCIRFPQKRSDLITEGQSLKHCVGGDRYAENHKKGTRMIFFVRKTEAPDKPFFTMEVVMKGCSIAQLYGFGDCKAPKKVRQFAEKFVKALRPKAASRRKAS